MNDNTRCACGGPIVWSQYHGVPYCLCCGTRYPSETARQHQARVLEDVKRAVAGKEWSTLKTDETHK